MNILLLNQFYPPDNAPTGKLLADLAEELVAQKHDVTVIASNTAYTGKATYPKYEKQNGVKIHRVKGLSHSSVNVLTKIINYGLYLGGLSRKTDHIPTPDLVVALTTPPFLGRWGRRIARKHNARHAHWIMDLYPDVLKVHGILAPANPLYRLLQGITRSQFSDATAIISLGPDMARQLQQYHPEGVGHWVGVWAAPPESLAQDRVADLRRERGWQPHHTVLMYSGNMGAGHDFEPFYHAAQSLIDKPLRWVFCGGGKRASSVRQAVSGGDIPNALFLDYVDSSQRDVHLASADVHLVTLRPGWEGVMVPSKIATLLTRGKPILFLGNPSSTLAQLIQENQAGWVVAPDDPQALIQTIEETLSHDERVRRAYAAQKLADKLFCRQKNLTELVTLLTRQSD